MKKLLLIAAVVTAAMFATSCQGPAGPQGPRGESGTNMTTVEFTVRGIFNNNSNAAGWWVTDDGAELIHERQVPSLTRDVVSYGAVVGYREINGTYMPLQHVSWIDDGQYAWQEAFTFGYKEGTLFVYFKDSDSNYDYPPGDTNFKFVLIY